MRKAGNSCPSPAMRLHQEDVAVTVPARFSLAFTLGLSLLPAAYGGTSDTPAPMPSPLTNRISNQDIAERIAARLRQSAELQRYEVNVSFRDGAAELSGSVADTEQRDQVLRLVQEVPGVQRVVDHLSVAGTIVPVQAPAVPETLPPVPSSNPMPPSAPQPPAAAV